MPRQPRELAEWMRRVEAMRECRTPAELVARHGEPAHKLEDPAMQIWHYPLGITGGTLYSIHVAVTRDDPPMPYMHVEPTSEPDTVAPRPSEDGWKTAAFVSMMLCYVVIFLWLEQPGQLYRFYNGGAEYSLRADFGQLLLTRWSVQAGLRLVWSLPLWPFVVLTAAVPLWVLSRYRTSRGRQARGFPVAAPKRSE